MHVCIRLSSLIVGVSTPQGKAGRQPKGEGWEEEQGNKSDACSGSSGVGHVSVSQSSRGSPMEYTGQDSPGARVKRDT